MPVHPPDEPRPPGLAPGAAQPSEAMWTALRYFALSRLVVAAALLAGVLAGSPLAPQADRAWLIDGLVAYCALALVFLLATPRLRPHFTPQVVAQVVTDLVFLALLSEAWGGLGGGIAVLQVAILSAAAVVSTRPQAAGFAAVLALLLLARAAWHVLLGDGDSLQVFQAGLVGAAGFVTALLVNWLALRLERAARLAQVRGEDLRAQLLVTQLVIAELQQGVLVFADDGSLRAINRAGAELLRLPESVAASADPPPVPADTALWRMLQTEGAALRRTGDGARELQLPAGPGSAARRVLLRVLSPPQAIGGFVLLVEDLRRVEDQARQLKLASMGRLSASIAHEVRNPLAAIRHANGLLAEQVEDPGLRRLTGIVEGNTLRIDRIVEDVLSISRRAPAQTEALDAGVWLPELVAELVAGGTATEGRIVWAVDSAGSLLFDPDHLRQVLVNLLGNALRHASGAAGAVRVLWHRRPDDRLELAIEDDGPGVAPDMLEHLFEPFLTTEARGTGLGLYLARELCNANGAALRYEPPRSRPPQPFRDRARRPSMIEPVASSASSLRPARGGRVPRILVVDDEADLRELLDLTLARMGLDVDCAADLGEARRLLAQQVYSLCLTDMRLPDGSGLDLVAQITRESPNTPVAVITAFGSTENAVAALKAGAFDYLAKPVGLDALRSLVRSAVGLPAATERPTPVAAGAAGVQLLGESAPIREVRASVTRLARSMAPVHITGESGSGKELAARLVHHSGGRADKPFVAVNCGAIPENLMESEFFGYRKGAFTGADQERDGFFQAAHGGTLFLDEVADLPLPMQVKLLRAIQEKRVRKIGATTEEPVDVRIISATHQDLGACVTAGRFRQDLYYRLNVIELQMPALRDRREDIGLLAEAMLGRLSARAGLAVVPRLASVTLKYLQSYAFPGNVRELENILERALAFSNGEVINVEDLGLRPAGAWSPGDERDEETGEAPHAAEVAGATADAAVLDAGFEPPEGEGDTVPVGAAPRPVRLVDGIPDSLPDYLDQLEREAIQRALERTRYNRTAAARLLGITFRALRYRMQRLGLN